MVSSPFEGKGHMGRRLVTLVVGLFILSFGIAMSKKASLGTAPISCIPATLTDCFGWTLGTWTIIFNTLLVVLEIVILGREFQKIQVLQIAMGVLLGSLCDFSMSLLTWLGPSNYLEQWIFSILSSAILAFGVMMEIRANLLVVPGDGLVMALAAKITKYPFHRLKIMVDSTLAVTACIISLLVVGYLTGAREGTIFAALMVGNFIGFYKAHFGRYIDRFIDDEEDQNA